MAFMRDLLELMPDTVTITAPAASTAPNIYGRTNYSTATTTYRCRWTPTNKSYRFDNQTINEAGVLVIASTAPLPAQAKITLPNGESPPVLWVKYPHDEDGQHHARVTLGWRS